MVANLMLRHVYNKTFPFFAVSCAFAFKVSKIIAKILCVQMFNQKAPNIILISTLLKKLKKIHRKKFINNVHFPIL